MTALKKILPINSLDYLINELGGPNNVAEMTGRKIHMVKLNGNEVKENDEQDIFCVKNRTATNQKTPKNKLILKKKMNLSVVKRE